MPIAGLRLICHIFAREFLFAPFNSLAKELYQVMPLMDLVQAAKALECGELVAIPTETVYGLAAKISDVKALERVFITKDRPLFDPLIVHVANLSQAQQLTADWNELAEFLAERFWPGPLTLVLPRAPHVSPLITAGLETVAIRCPAHDLTRQLIERTGPLAAPSANRFGKTSPTTAQHVLNEFTPEIAVVDGGPCQIGIESTVLEPLFQTQEQQWEVRLLRPGGVDRSSLKSALVQFSHPVEIVRATSQASPGHLLTHYQPRAALVIKSNLITETNSQSTSSATSIAAEIRQQLQLTSNAQIVEWILPDSPALAARRLYADLRMFDQHGAAAVIVTQQPQHFSDEWEAVWDRLQRAATLRMSNSQTAMSHK